MDNETIRKNLVAMEHPSSKALKKYLHDHPGAEPSDHTVEKKDSKSSGDSSKSEARSKDTTKHLDDMKSLKSKVERADPSAKKKFDKAYDKLYENGESAAKSAEKLIKSLKNEDAIRSLKDDLGAWKRNQTDHHRAADQMMVHKKLQQAEQTHGYAWKLDDTIKMVLKEESSMKTAFEKFQNVLIARKVFERFAKEFPSSEALQDYLHDHPKSDKSKHRVVDPDTAKLKKDLKDFDKHQKGREKAKVKKDKKTDDDHANKLKKELESWRDAK